MAHNQTNDQMADGSPLPSRAQRRVRDMNRAEILATYPVDDRPFDTDDFHATIVAETGVSRGFVDVVLESEMMYLMSHGFVTDDPDQQLGRDEQDQPHIEWGDLIVVALMSLLALVVLGRDHSLYPPLEQGVVAGVTLSIGGVWLWTFARSVYWTVSDRRAARREVA